MLLRQSGIVLKSSSEKCIVQEMKESICQIEDKSAEQMIMQDKKKKKKEDSL